MIKYILVIILSIALFSLKAFAIEKAERITDRELIEALAELRAGQIVLEKRIDGIEKRIDGIEKRIDGIEKRIDSLQAIILGGFGILFTGMMALIGFVLWDRRTALAPAIRKNKELEEREELLEKALKEYAKEEPRLQEILKSLKLL